ncbi:M20/M25/M40 family metallo-hydrolase, partial [Streptococcus suis]
PTHSFLTSTLAVLLPECTFAQVRTWKTGILVYLTGSAPEKTIGWRADIDGLPIVEETGLDFKSLHPDRMHACGHDFHMTIAFGLLEKMAEQQPKN